MKKIFNYICLASLLALSTACQDDNLVTKENGTNTLTFSVSYASDPQSKAQTRSLVEFTDEDGKPTPFDISLSVEDTYAETPITRGTPISTLKNFTDNVDYFKAWGYYGSEDWIGIQGTKFKQYAGSDYRPVDGSDEEINAYKSTYTEKDLYHFYAIYPYCDNYDTETSKNRGVTNVNCTSAGLTFTYTSPDDGDNDALAQKEVLAGYIGETTSSMSVVPITFQPTLAAIQFRVSNKLGRDVKIKSIELHTLSKTGTCTISDTGVDWSGLGTPVNANPFTQDFGYTIDHEQPGGNIVGNDIEKTFFIIPQTGKSDVDAAGKPAGTRIVINYYESDESESDPPHQAVHLLFGQKFEAGKTYVYSIGDFEGSATKMEPWVEFAQFSVNDPALVKGENEIHEENNAKFIFDFKQTFGTYEKAYFTIHNLEVDHWYSIEFTERITLFEDGVENTVTPFGDVGSYACRVSDSKIEPTRPTRYQEMIPYYSDKANPPFIWQHPNNIYQETSYSALYPNTTKLTFKATAPEMVWNWDYSKGEDTRNGVTRVLRAEIYLMGEKIKDITPKSGDGVATVDFLNATIYNCAQSTNNRSNSSHKTYAVDATYDGSKSVEGTLACRIINSGYGRLNIPLLNLNTSKTYQITYTLDKEGTTSTRTGNNYGLGYVLQTTANTANTTFNPTTNVNYEKSLRGEGTKETFNVTKSFEFTPTASTMYWVWDFSEFGTDYTDHQFVTFKDVTIEEVVTP